MNMRYITATEANQNMSRLLRDVATGATYTVTSRGKPVAKIGPPDDTGKRKNLSEFHDFLKSRPVIHAVSWTREDLYD